LNLTIVLHDLINSLDVFCGGKVIKLLIFLLKIEAFLKKYHYFKKISKLDIEDLLNLRWTFKVDRLTMLSLYDDNTWDDKRDFFLGPDESGRV